MGKSVSKKAFLNSDHTSKLEISTDGKQLFWNEKRVVLLPFWWSVIGAIVGGVFAVTGFVSAILGIISFFDAPASAVGPAGVNRVVTEGEIPQVEQNQEAVDETETGTSAAE